jgi:hypothetical protein
MLTILNSNLIRLQWAMLLLVYMVTPTTWAAPTASFTTDVDPEGPPYFVYLNAVTSSPWQGDQKIVDFKWSNSKNGSILPNITSAAIFDTAGTYSITLTVWDAAGNSDTLTKSVIVPPNGDSPTPRFDIVRTNGLTVYVNASASTPGKNNGSITKYDYYIGSNLYHTATVPQTSFTLKEKRTYTISLNVTDSNGKRSTTPAQQTVSIGEIPTPSFKVGEINGFTVKVDASASSPGNNSGSITKYEYEAVSYGQFGIDSSKSHIATTPKTSITFDKAGSYTISLHVTDNNGNRSNTPAQQTNVKIQQETEPPIVPLTANFTTGAIDGCRVSVNASASTPLNRISKYEYTWQQSGSTESGNVTRDTDYSDITLPQSGTYNISLKVFDASGNSSINTSNQNVTIGTSCASTEDSTQLNQGSSFGNLIYGDPNTTVTNDDFTIMVTANIGSDINAFEPLTLEAISAEGFVVGNGNSVDINATIVPSPEHENVYIVIVIGWDDQEGLTDWGKVKWYYKVLPKDILNDGWKRFAPELSDLSNLSIPQYIMARSGEQSHSVNVFTGQLLPPEIEDFGTARRVHFVVGYTPNNDLYLLSQPITLKVPGL